jgi:hypothetical protein
MMGGMKWLTILMIASSLLVTASLAYAVEPEPFAQLKVLTNNGTQWGIENYRNADAFNAERDRLGANFVRAVIEFAGSNSANHYWCGVYLTEKNFLRGKKPMRNVATALWEQGLVLERQQNKKPSARLRCFHALLAIEYERNALHALASAHKSQAEQIGREYGIWGLSAHAENDSVYKKIAVEEMPTIVAERPH